MFSNSNQKNSKNAIINIKEHEILSLQFFSKFISCNYFTNNNNNHLILKSQLNQGPNWYIL